MPDFRRQVLLDGLSPASLLGLEIGPLADPIVRREDGEVIYVDHADAAALRQKYAGGGLDVAAIVEVDAIWAGRSLRETVGRCVDYVMASHVAEHVPDLISWLEEVRDVLRPGGELRLALPDARYSFDYFRQPTRLSELVAAWMIRARRPQLPQILDFVLNFTPGIKCEDIDAGVFDPSSVARHYSFAGAVELAQRTLDDPAHYEDVHCWVFSPAHFADLMLQLSDAGLLHMACSRFIDTEPQHLWEFYVFLRPCDDAAAARASWERMRAAASPRRPQPPPPCAEHLVAEQRVAALEASLSWRVTAPLRAVSRLLKRLAD
jgi:SAM-dependent methyltransferase